MTLIERLRRIERLDGLIRRKATGSPKQLAAKLNVSERCVYRLIDEMKTLGCPIEYCRLRKSYQYERAIEMRITLEVDDRSMHKIKGGRKVWQNYLTLPKIGSKNHDIARCVDVPIKDASCKKLYTLDEEGSRLFAQSAAAKGGHSY